MITIMIVDDQTLMREGLKTIIELEDDMKVVATAENGEEAISKAVRIKPDIILMDIQMPVMNGIDSLIEIKAKLPHIKILILTTFAQEDYIISGLIHGSDGFLLKDMNYDQLIKSMRDAYEGQVILPNQIAQKLAKRIKSADSITHSRPFNEKELQAKGIYFSKREMEVVHLLMTGCSNKKIAETLFISEGTVKNYISEIYKKIDINDRVQAIVYLNQFTS
ncbi:response regulator [Alkalihalobacillus pseudalcaliphilus]|uniref:response regulator n=1 Tax=Alkalihalobacillus pseudalcaliphilus TaxID=79884 RepID=UPI00064D843D|nr:response regulator transcription factor [Alkalihalobacillus pseudalcaliphilus]KMK78173.1 LuxR family transcriptional regulator [Alkalihalobacillus pseudalcaliphilus]